MATMASTSRNNWLALVLLLTLSALSVGGELADRSRAGSGPTEAALTAAISEIKAGWQPGDAVRVTPSWWESPWHRLSGIGEGANAPPFPALLASPHEDSLTLTEFSRIWVLGAWDHAPERAPLVAGLGPPQHRAELGEGVALARFDLGPPPQMYRATGNLDSLQVRRQVPGADTRSCPRQGGVFRCGMDPWLDVKVTHRDVGGRHVRWLYAHPGPGSGALEIRWDKPPEGKWALLRVGHTQAAVRRDEGEPVQIRLLQNDSKTLHETTLDRHTYTLVEHLAPLDEPPLRSLTIEVRSPVPHWREVMAELIILSEEPRGHAAVVPPP